jgi:hypothetical protein
VTTVVSAVHCLAGPGRASPESVDRDGNSNVVDTAADVEADVVLADVPTTHPDRAEASSQVINGRQQPKSRPPHFRVQVQGAPSGEPHHKRGSIQSTQRGSRHDPPALRTSVGAPPPIAGPAIPTNRSPRAINTKEEVHMSNQRITTTIALTLALAASIAPAAVASSTASPAVRPNPDEQTAFSAPAITGASCGDVCSGHGYGPVNVTAPTPATPVSCDVCSGHGYGPVSTPATVVPVVAPGDGFDLGDAGIGAGSMLAMIGLGGALIQSRRRDRIHSQHAS